jgi:arsenite methyltransferase
MMQRLVEKALANPWAALDYVVDGPLHPGGHESTATLLDRAAVTEGTRVLDAGCGTGESVALAQERGAHAVGLDRNPPPDGIRGDLSRLPVQDDTFDVVLAECVMCLVPGRSLAFRETGRVLADGGRLALSDMVVSGEVPELPAPMSEVLCLSNTSDRETLVDRVETAGFAVEDVRDHREDLLAMRDQIAGRVDYGGLLGHLGERGDRLLAAIEELETRVESGEISYVSLVAHPVEPTEGTDSAPAGSGREETHPSDSRR